MVPFCEDKLFLKHYLCHLYRLISAYCLEFWAFYEELTPLAVMVQTFCSAMALWNSLFFMFHQFATYNAAKSPKANVAATTQGFYLFCTCPSESVAYFDGAT
jgi:hypothetical protein